MKPPKDTQRFPAQDRPENQYAATEQFAAAPNGGSGRAWSESARADSAGSSSDSVSDFGAASDSGSKSGKGGGRRTGMLIGIGVVVVAVLLVVGAIGVELGMRKSISDRLTEEVTASLGSQAEVDLGPGLVIMSYFDKSLDSVHITTDGVPAEGSTSPAPAIDITAEGVREEGDLTHVDSLSGTAFVSDQTMATAAQSDSESGAGAAGGMLGGLLQVQDVVSDPDSGTLRVSISGLAEATVTPRLTEGNLELEPEGASVFGFELPSSLLGGTISMMDSALADLPDGVELTGVRVVDGGMTVDLSGKDVLLDSTR